MPKIRTPAPRRETWNPVYALPGSIPSESFPNVKAINGLE